MIHGAGARGGQSERRRKRGKEKDCKSVAVISSDRSAQITHSGASEPANDPVDAISRA